MLSLLQLAFTSFSDGFHQGEKPLNKEKWFPLARKPVSTNLSEGFCWKALFNQTKKKTVTGTKAVLDMSLNEYVRIADGFRIVETFGDEQDLILEDMDLIKY